ncbi:unnamed protein product [Brassicogethes aeneus]|uniref:Non-lysosomal glucosylceramidase n=1 Tax=Brassicogethes aeneus TaxID=1431903 RepID=A0A9P0FF76_BRAAE|nr:unnamed protein product [Brassicogethes aeneus]
MGDVEENDYVNVPKYGLKNNLDHVYPEFRKGNYKPCFRIIWEMLPFFIRYLWYYIKAQFTGKSIVMDGLYPLTSKQCYGVPMGGIGSGTIGRGFRGEFLRFQLKPGLYEHNTVDANQFIITIKDDKDQTIFHSLLSTNKKKGLRDWTSTLDGSRCKYTGLYPRSWTEYDLSEYGVTLKCRQVSPVIPHNYKDSSMPCAVFVWDIVNVSESQRTVTIALTFKNGTGTKKQDGESISSSNAFSFGESSGVILHHTVNKMPCTYALAAKNRTGTKLTRCLYFDPNSNGSKPWLQLKNQGEFEERCDGQRYGEMAVGIACKTALKSKGSAQLQMALAWDMPTVTFPKGGKKYRRFYSEFFKKENASLYIVEYAFENFRDWEKQIYEWQAPVLNNESLPDWYKSALFNETYFISDGGSVWVSPSSEEIKEYKDNDPRKTVGKFLYLEGHEYRMFNSYDVHFYASHALSKNWPQLQNALQYDLRDAVFMDIPDKVYMLYDAETVPRKVPDTVPHDNGDPGEEPWLLPNAYPIHDVATWKDLNSKFVLQTYRDAKVSGKGELDKNFVTDMYDACYKVMIELQKSDKDNDGLVENAGKPDQTFDVWVMSGPSAYCGGLWLAACYVMTIFAKLLNKECDRLRFQNILDKGKESFEKILWNGEYYNFDTSKKESTAIMADQLCFQWYLRCCGIQDYPIISKENIKKSLKTIFQNNVLKFSNGDLGAVNGWINGNIDPTAVQSLESWTGVTYALAGHLIFEGMYNEGFKTAGGMYKSMRDKFGLSFDTPEALYEKGYYRSIGYMRPLSIWSMQMAIEEKEKMGEKILVCK